MFHGYVEQPEGNSPMISLMIYRLKLVILGHIFRGRSAVSGKN